MTETKNQFADLPEAVQEGIRDLNWSEPTAVQARVIPVMRAGRDLIVQAHTGSGKTGAFGLPIVSEIDAERAEPQALILLPTRELANQVAAEITILGKHIGVRCLPVYGGVGYAAQLEGIEAGSHVIVGTPGRILDHLGSGRLKLDTIRFLVLDEADELLSLGFWPDMKKIESYVAKRGERQSCLFSATMPEKVRSLARVFLDNPEFVALSEGQIAPQQIEHFFYLVSAQEKEQALVKVLEYDDPESAIIFCNTKDDVRFVSGFLQRRGFDADQISGDLNQAARERAMGRIKAGELRYLVATDVAARGIDISDLTHVISYAAPDSPEVYVHRTGRTGRAGKAGVAISIVSALDIGNFRYLQQVNRIEIAERSLPGDLEMAKRLRDRLAVKVEHEMREIPESDRGWKVGRFVRVVEEMADNEEGRRDLAAICAAYLEEHRPVTSVADPPDPGSDDRDARRDERPRRSGDRSRQGRRRPRRSR